LIKVVTNIVTSAVFGRFLFRIWAGTRIMTDISRGFPQLFPVNAGIVPKINT